MPLASLDGWEVLSCLRCRGVLLPQQTFRELISARRARAAGPARPPRLLDAAELRRQVGCPACKLTMNTHPYYGPGNIVIDTCADCGLLWLDFGELSRVVDAPGRDRGDYRLFLKDLLEDEEDDD
jgi:Zn-finger nucleic acid-binding protein